MEFMVILNTPADRMLPRKTAVSPSVLFRYKSDIDCALRKELSGDTLSVYQMLRYSLGWVDLEGKPSDGVKGKALRPTLCLLASEADGRPVSKAMPAAVSLELIHNFSLIHDDIQDQDETRHQRSTLWAALGGPKALIAGNTLRAIADRALWSLVHEGVTFEEALVAAELLTQAYLEMIEGQYLDLAFEGRSDIGIDDYLAMISRKTGSLIRCALNVGAMLGGCKGEVVSAFRECGRSLGLVFQIRDDLLGVWGDETIIGKPVGADIRRKKNTLPVVYAMSRAVGTDKQMLQATYTGDEVGDVEVTRVLDVLERMDVMDYMQSLATKHCELALKSLSTVELPTKTFQDIWEISYFLLDRDH